MSEFFQKPPKLTNQFQDDRTLQEILARAVPIDAWREMEPDLHRMGERAVGDIAEMGQDAETNPPKLVSFDPWGRRVDEIVTSPGWQQLDRVSAEEGIVATAYERRHGEFSRLHQIAKLYLFNPSSAIYSCPLAMTDGAARLIEVHGDQYLKDRAFTKLTSRDPDQFWTSGQWMTERTGGSDVSGTSTIARRTDNGRYRLAGTKWFTSATTSQMAMTLARIEDADGNSVDGSRGLSLFYLETRRPDGSLNGITIHRLKDKLGTKALPTAELTLDGTEAILIGKPGEGVKRIVTLVNVTRIYNSVCAVSGMRRAIALARDYAGRRSAFGLKLSQQPLHLETLAEMEVEFQGAAHLVFHLAMLLGKDEVGIASEEERAVLRALTPVAKLYTAKQGVAVTSEVLESFGGAGYVEDTGLPRLLRDAQVLPIWEGTTNVLSLDLLRSMAKENTLPPLMDHLLSLLRRCRSSYLEEEIERVTVAVGDIADFAGRMAEAGPEFSQSVARSFAYAIARTSIAALLLDHADFMAREKNDGRALAVARRWCRKNLTPWFDGDEDERNQTKALALDESIMPPFPARA